MDKHDLYLQRGEQILLLNKEHKYSYRANHLNLKLIGFLQ